jgi:DNA phosphorothioation-associated putative methyltransferase
VARALEDGIITSEMRVLDYGCGRGGDLARLERLGVRCLGYDPVYRPEHVREPCDVANLGYVLNVIESPEERRKTLERVWSLTRGCLVVSARLRGEEGDLHARACGDGYLTSRGTFQRFFTQGELRTLIEETLAVRAVAAAPGVFYVFRDSSAEQSFLARRVRRAAPSRSRLVFEQHELLLGMLVLFVDGHGRLPRGEERRAFRELEAELGSVRNAFLVIRRVTGDERWDRIRGTRTDDLLVYLALARFARRPPFGALPPELRYDIREFFGSYKAACAQADRLLFAISESARIQAAIGASRVGKRTREAFYVHDSALGDLAPILRVLEGCARVLIGTVEGATLVKFRGDRPVVTYLSYPEFDTEPHPALRFVYTVNLESLRVDYRDYGGHRNPPILHRKELFVSAEYPHREMFARLTRQELRHGLYRQPDRIGTRKGWVEMLANRGLGLRGHRVVAARQGLGAPPAEASLWT